MSFSLCNDFHNRDMSVFKAVAPEGVKILDFNTDFQPRLLCRGNFENKNHCFVFIYILHMECRGFYIVVYCLWCLSMHIFSVCFDVCASLCNKVPWSTLCIYLFWCGKMVMICFVNAQKASPLPHSHSVPAIAQCVFSSLMISRWSISHGDTFIYDRL